jgi:hypothetical protein
MPHDQGVTWSLGFGIITQSKSAIYSLFKMSLYYYPLALGTNSMSDVDGLAPKAPDLAWLERAQAQLRPQVEGSDQF